ncbi:MAG TPA: hypothetical protein VFF81_00545 [Noviherbaspirillum sp.]|nr:hypothetical protein [Noviherbaspirillum sp.]
MRSQFVKEEMSGNFFQVKVSTTVVVHQEHEVRVHLKSLPCRLKLPWMPALKNTRRRGNRRVNTILWTDGETAVPDGDVFALVRLISSPVEAFRVNPSRHGGWGTFVFIAFHNSLGHSDKDRSLTKVSQEKEIHGSSI